MHELYVVGIGPGDENSITYEAARILRSADVVVAAKRHLPLIEKTAGAANPLLMEGIEKTLAEIGEKLKHGNVAVAVSGDPGVFSLLKRLQDRFADRKIQTIPGISSLQRFCAALGESWDDAAVMSVHGRELSEPTLA